MNTFNVNADMDIEVVDDDEYGDVEGRPLIGWFLMAVALVAMAFLIGAGPEASAQPIKASVSAQAVVSAPAVSPRASADLAFGG